MKFKRCSLLLLAVSFWLCGTTFNIINGPKYPFSDMEISDIAHVTVEYPGLPFYGVPQDEWIELVEVLHDVVLYKRIPDRSSSLLGGPSIFVCIEWTDGTFTRFDSTANSFIVFDGDAYTTEYTSCKPVSDLVHRYADSMIELYWRGGSES